MLTSWYFVSRVPQVLCLFAFCAVSADAAKCNGKDDDGYCANVGCSPPFDALCPATCDTCIPEAETREGVRKMFLKICRIKNLLQNSARTISFAANIFSSSIAISSSFCNPPFPLPPPSKFLLFFLRLPPLQSLSQVGRTV